MATLLAKLLDKAQRSIHVALEMVYVWTDSTVVLDGSQKTYKTYVGNHIATTLSLLPTNRRNQVNKIPPTVLHAGCSPSSSSLMNYGERAPSHWMFEPPACWSTQLQLFPAEPSELRANCNFVQLKDVGLLEKCSIYIKLKGTTA